MKKTIPMSRALIMIAIVSTMLLVVLTNIIAGFFFRRIVSDIYGKANRDVTGSTLGGLTVDESISLQKLMLEVNEIVRSKDDPAKEAFEDREKYLEAFKKTGTSGQYRYLWTLLNNVRKGTESTSLDLVLVYPEEGIEVFIIDASDANVLPCGELHYFNTEAYKDFKTREFAPVQTNSPVYGPLMTDGSIFYVDEEAGFYSFLLSDIPMREVTIRRRYFLLNVMLVTLFGMIFIGIIFSHNVRSGVTNPVRRITDAAKSFVEQYEDRTAGQRGGSSFNSIDGGNITELNELVGSLQSMENEMSRYLVELHQMTAERTRIETELDLARRIQMSMMPDDFLDASGQGRADLFASMTPAKEVGGDFYDFYLIDPDHLCLVMADVSGKGVPAALFMMICKIMLKNYVTSGQTDPARILENLNEQISNGNRENMFVTIWLGILDLRDGTVKAVNAGHEYPILKKPGYGFELFRDRHGMLAGIQPGIRYQSYEFQLEPGGGIFLYTDGLTEAASRDRRMFGLQRVIRELNNAPETSSEEIISHMNRSVRYFVGDALQFDDLTMLCMIYHGPGEDNGPGQA